MKALLRVAVNGTPLCDPGCAHSISAQRVFEAAMQKVLPGSRIDRLQLSHPVFDTFCSIKSLDVPYPGRLGESGLMGEFHGIHEGNDPSNRLMVVINYNRDIGDYMEHSGRGFYAALPMSDLRSIREPTVPQICQSNKESSVCNEQLRRIVDHTAFDDPMNLADVPDIRERLGVEDAESRQGVALLRDAVNRETVRHILRRTGATRPLDHSRRANLDKSDANRYRHWRQRHLAQLLPAPVS